MFVLSFVSYHGENGIPLLTSESLVKLQRICELWDKATNVAACYDLPKEVKLFEFTFVRSQNADEYICEDMVIPFWTKFIVSKVRSV